MANSVQRNITVKLKSDDKSLQRGLRASSMAVSSFGRKVKGLTLGIGGLGLAGLVGGAGLGALASRISDSIDANAKLATSLDTSVGQVQQLRLAASLTGTDLGTLEKATIKASQVLGQQLINPSRSVAEALAQIGVSASDFADADPVTIFKELAQRVGAIESPITRAAVGAALFGRSWSKLVPLMNDSKSVFADVEALLVDTGVAMSDADASGVEKLEDGFEKLTTLGSALTEKVLAKMAPTLTRIVNELGKGAVSFIEMTGGGEDLANMISTKIIGGFNDLVEALSPAIRLMGYLFDAVGILVKVLDVFITTLVTGLDLIVAIGKAIGHAFDGEISIGFDVLEGAAKEAMDTLISMVPDSIVSLFSGGGSDGDGGSGGLIADLGRAWMDAFNESAAAADTAKALYDFNQEQKSQSGIFDTELPEQTQLLRDIVTNTAGGARAG